MCRLQLAIAYAGLDRRFGDVRSRKRHIHRLVAMVLLDGESFGAGLAGCLHGPRLEGGDS
jgi:hypothetical protein